MALNYTATTLTSGYASVDKLNENFAKIQTALTDAVSRSGFGANAMTSPLDMNSQKLINVAPGVSSSDGVNYGQLLDLAAGAIISDAEYNIVSTYTVMKSLTPTNNDVLQVLGRNSAGSGGGLFRFDSSDLSTKVSLDTREIIYVTPNTDATGASGAWVRILPKPSTIFSSWAGAIADNSTNNTPIIQACFDLARDLWGGGVVYLEPSPEGMWHQGSGPLRFWDNIEFCGDKVNSKWENVGRSASQQSVMFLVGNISTFGSITGETQFPLNSIAINDKQVTLTTASQDSNFAVGDVVFISSVEYSDSPNHIVPDEQCWNEVTSVSSGVLSLKYPIADTITNAQIAKPGLGSTVDWYGDALWVPKKVHIHNLTLKNPTNQTWGLFQFSGGFETHVHDLIVEECESFWGCNVTAYCRIHDIDIKLATRKIFDLAYGSIASHCYNINFHLEAERDPVLVIAHGENARDCVFENINGRIIGPKDTGTPGIDPGDWTFITNGSRRTVVRNCSITADSLSQQPINFPEGGPGDTGSTIINSRGVLIENIKFDLTSEFFEGTVGTPCLLRLSSDQSGTPSHYNIVRNIVLNSPSWDPESRLMIAGSPSLGGFIIENITAPGMPNFSSIADLSDKEIFVRNIYGFEDDLAKIIECNNDRSNNVTKTAIRTYPISAGTLVRSSGTTYGATAKLIARSSNTNGTNLYVDLDVGTFGNHQFNIPSSNRGLIIVEWYIQFHVFNGGTSYAKCTFEDGSVETDYVFLSGFDFQNDDLDLIVSTNHDSASDNFDLHRYEVEWHRGYITDRR